MRRIIISLIGCIIASLFCSANAQVGLFIRPNSSSLSAPVSGQTWLFDSSNLTMQVFNGSGFQTASAPLNNFVAILAPAVVNDNTQGYSPGSEWYNTTNSYVYSCVDATTGAAIWVQINNLGSLTIPLNNIQAGGASSGQSLIYNGTHWAPGVPSINLSAVLQSGATTGQVPVWNGSAWVPGTTGGGSVSPSFSSFIPIPTVSISSFNATANTGYALDFTGYGNTVCTLPDARTCGGRTILFVVSYGVGLGQCTFLTTDSQTVNNGAVGNIQGLTFQGTSYEFLSDGANWWIAALGGTLDGYPVNSAYSFSNQIVMQNGGQSEWGFGWASVNQKTYTSGSNPVNQGDPTLIYADSSGGTNTLTLPPANFVPGKVYCIIPINFTNPIVINLFAGDSLFLYGSSTPVTTLTLDPASSNSYPIILTSDGNSPGNWIQVTPIATKLVYQQNTSFTALGNTTQYVDTTTSGLTCTLPDATEVVGQIITITNTNGLNTLAFTSTTSQTVSGNAASAISLIAAGASITLESDGSNWWITARYLL